MPVLPCQDLAAGALGLDLATIAGVLLLQLDPMPVLPCQDLAAGAGGLDLAGFAAVVGLLVLQDPMPVLPCQDLAAGAVGLDLQTVAGLELHCCVLFPNALGSALVALELHCLQTLAAKTASGLRRCRPLLPLQIRPHCRTRSGLGRHTYRTSARSGSPRLGVSS